jgi:glycosyltransferase involved in cell wall biosynthesis
MSTIEHQPDLSPRRATDGEAADEAPVLSVVIACLNAAATLGTQLEALAAQPCPVTWELLVCDNGSTDASVAVAERYRDRVPALRVVDASAVRGAGPARNLGVELAHGRWVAFCDADDEVAEDWLTTMCEALTDDRFVAGRFESRKLNSSRVLRSRPLQQDDDLQSSEIGARLPHAGGGNMGIHRADFLAAGGFDPAIPWLEDTDFSWRVQQNGVPLVFHPEVIVHVRLRQTFRSMYVQGRQYGRAYALLERRYGAPAMASPVVPAAVTAAAARPVPFSVRMRRLVDSFVDHVFAGKLAWRLGWVVGHRQPLRAGPPPKAAQARRTV